MIMGQGAAILKNLFQWYKVSWSEKLTFLSLISVTVSLHMCRCKCLCVKWGLKENACSQHHMFWTLRYVHVSPFLSPLPFHLCFHTVMLTLEERNDQPYFCLVPETKPSALGWAKMKWGKVCRGGENVPFVAPQPYSPYLSISCLPLTPTPASSPTLKGMVRAGEGGGLFIQHRLNVFTAAHCRGGVGRCKPGREERRERQREREREGGASERERQRERVQRTTGWPTTGRNHVAPLTLETPHFLSFLLSHCFFLFLLLPHQCTQAYCPNPCMTNPGHTHKHRHWQSTQAGCTQTHSHFSDTFAPISYRWLVKCK